MLADFPDGSIDAQMLTSLLSANGGRGTPLGNDDMPTRGGNDNMFSGGFLGSARAESGKPRFAENFPRVHIKASEI